MLLAPAAQAADLELSIELPRHAVAEYHRPYTAIWLERPDQSFAANLAVWYQLQESGKGEKGSTWLKDLRAWWRKSGRELSMPVDGLSGATRAPGIHRLRFTGTKAPFASLALGEYQLVVEVARESGGREILRIPFSWKGQSVSVSAKGSHEIGQVQIFVKPQ